MTTRVTTRNGRPAHARKGLVGQRLRNARTVVGLSQEVFAKRIGVTARSVANWETERTSPTLRDLFRLCEVFGFEPVYFVS